MNALTSLLGRRNRFETLVGPEMERLYRFAFRLTGQQADAEDLVQELLVRLYPRRSELEQVELLGPWLARALYNLFVDRHRRQSNDPLGGHETLDAVEAVAEGERPEQLAEQSALRRQLERALAILNPEQRALVALHDMEGRTLPEIAQVLELPLGTLKSRLHRARARLREYLSMEPQTAFGRVRNQGGTS